MNIPRIFLFAFVSLFMLCAPAANGDERLVMAQIHRLEGTTEAEIGAELDRLKSAGFNTIILRAFQNRGDRFHALAGLEKGADVTGVYFRTEAAPLVADLVPSVARLAHARGMKCYAWITTRRMDWLKRSDWLDIAMNAGTGKPAAHEVFDLFHPAFQEYLLTLLADLAAQPVDGIILQDDFVILTREGLTSFGLEGFRRQTGRRISADSLFSVRRSGAETTILPSGKLFQQWSVFKASHLAALGERIVRRCKAVRAGIEVCINLYYDTVIDPGQGLAWLSQDLQKIRDLSFDRILVMAYHRQMAHERSLDVTETIATLAAKIAELNVAPASRLIVKLEARDWLTGEEPGEAERLQLRRLIPTRNTNVAFAPVERDSALYRSLRSLLDYSAIH